MNISSFKLRSFLFGLLVLLQVPLFSKVIIFDLNNVLFTTSRWGMAREIGLWKLIINKLGGGDIKKSVFTFLEQAFGKQEPYNPSDQPDSLAYAMGDGIILPQIWCDNMCGALSSDELIKQCMKKINAYFPHGNERKLIKKFIKKVFNPAVFADNTSPIEQGAALLVQCAEQKDTTIMILSNLAADTFDALYKKTESRIIFDHVKPENLIISGKVGMLKPDPALYELVRKRLIALDSRFTDPYFLSQNCVFIDDQFENIVGARKAGIPSLWLTDGDYTKLREELKVLDVIS